MAEDRMRRGRRKVEGKKVTDSADNGFRGRGR
jgi:hypothetical protein